MSSEYAMLTLKAAKRYLLHRRIPKAKGKRIIIAGNGPSLGNNLENHLPILQREPVLCVNHFADSPEFELVKPDYYFMLDPSLSTVQVSDARKKARDQTFNRINETTDWDMHLFFHAFPARLIWKQL